MLKFYKQHLYKKYRDEIWGRLICQKKFSYNRRSVLLHYKELALNRRVYLSTKYRYFRRRYLRRLRASMFRFQLFKRYTRILNTLFLRKVYSENLSIKLPLKWKLKTTIKILTTKKKMLKRRRRTVKRYVGKHYRWKKRRFYFPFYRTIRGPVKSILYKGGRVFAGEFWAIPDLVYKNYEGRIKKKMAIYKKCLANSSNKFLLNRSHLSRLIVYFFSCKRSRLRLRLRTRLLSRLYLRAIGTSKLFKRGQNLLVFRLDLLNSKGLVHFGQAKRENSEFEFSKNLTKKIDQFRLFNRRKSNYFIKLNSNPINLYFYGIGVISALIKSKKKMHVNYLRTRFFTFPVIFSNRSFMWRRHKILTVGPGAISYAIRRKLRLRHKRAFFYAVHVAAPRKREKRGSLFGLRKAYYKKIAAFFGFKKVAYFLKFCRSVANADGNLSFIFLMLEARLETFLFRINFFPSPYFIKKFIQQGKIFVNNKRINHPAYVLNFNEIVSIDARYHSYIIHFLTSTLSVKPIFIKPSPFTSNFRYVSRRVNNRNNYRGYKNNHFGRSRKFFNNKLRQNRFWRWPKIAVTTPKSILLNFPDFVEVDYKLLLAMVIRYPQLSNLTSPVSFNLYTKFLTLDK